jgi:excisionase family DNA binding protein
MTTTTTNTLSDDDLVALVEDRFGPEAAAAIRDRVAPRVDLDRGGLMTTRQLAERLGVSVRTIEGWRRTGTGPRFVKVGRVARYHPDDVARWVAAGGG